MVINKNIFLTKINKIWEIITFFYEGIQKLNP